MSNDKIQMAVGAQGAPSNQIEGAERLHHLSLVICHLTFVCER